MSDDKSAILKRRARLVQSTLLAASLAVGSAAGCDGEPAPCLSFDIESDTHTPDVSDVSDDGDAQEDTETDTQPQVCLSDVREEDLADQG